jgi:hypothetical protein
MATKKMGLSRAASEPTNSAKKRGWNRQGWSSPPRSASSVSVIHPCCPFHQITGRRDNTRNPRARYGPGRRRWARAGGQRKKKSAQLRSWNSAVYLLRKPKPRQRPAPAQYFSEPVCTARQPATIEAAQKKTDGESTVSNVAPKAANGMAENMTMSQKPARALASAAMNQSMTSESSAASTGERNRTPKAVSPHTAVPRNCA